MPIEYGEVSLLARRLGRIPLEMRAHLKPQLYAAGRIIADQAKRNASYSRRIPAAIRVTSRLSSSGGVVIRVSASRAPHAKALEGRTRAGTTKTAFRHPVFGNGDVWVGQQTRPFLHRAVQQKKGEAMDRSAAAVRSATRLEGHLP